MRSTRSVTPRRARPQLRGPAYVSPQYHSRRWSRLGFASLIIGICVIVGVGGGFYWSLHRAQGSGSNTVKVHVGVGDTVTSVANRLQTDGLINSSLLFRIDARLHDLSAKLKVGDYNLRPNMSIDQMVAALTLYQAKTVRIVIPEGKRLEEVAAIVSTQHINPVQFLKVAEHPDFQLSIMKDKPPRASLEGYLFPNTYGVPRHYSARSLVQFMVTTLDKKFTPAMRADAAQRGWSVYQVLTLASIVERETRSPRERSIIASVYENRLKQKIGLYADPTVQYAVGTPKNWWPVLSSAQTQLNVPYNTYIHPGLPPGPIASPGLASILAVIHPRPTNFLYFVAKGDGTHAFSRTYQQQQANIQKYQHQ